MPGDQKLSGLLELAKQHRSAGRLQQADEICCQILQAAPDHPIALHLRALIAHKAGKHLAAIELNRQAIAVNSRDPLLHWTLAEMFRLDGDLNAALVANNQALSLQADYAEAQNSLGLIFSAQGRHEEALLHFSRAVVVSPELTSAHSNMGRALVALGPFDEALAPKTETIRLDPTPDAFYTRAVTFFQLKRFDEAEDDATRILALQPSHADAHMLLAASNLLQGKLAEGFAHFEWRWGTSIVTSRPSLPTPWIGNNPSGKRLLVYTEQGLGDTLQFCRYLPRLHEQGAQLVLSAQNELRTLIGTNMPWLHMPQVRDKLPPTDIQCSLLSLPHLFGTTLATIPNAVPYLAAPSNADARFAAIRQIPDLKVGLVWAGNPNKPLDTLRSISLSTLTPIFQVRGARFFSLQVGAAAQAHTNLIDLAPMLADFAQTAGAIASLDLVITVDTAVAHLAGAMGKPVWIMLEFIPDWRWLLDRTDSPWYPTARLFRQKTSGDWGPVIKDVGDALAAAARNKHAA
jgi:tetratricopeptide (TPR) repeat protein